jgi:hypothetical protein
MQGHKDKNRFFSVFEALKIIFEITCGKIEAQKRKDNLRISNKRFCVSAI